MRLSYDEDGIKISILRMKKVKQPRLDEFTTDLEFKEHSKKVLVLPHRYPHWEKIKGELEVLASYSKKSPEKSIDQAYRVIRLTQNVKLKALECFCHFLEAVEAGKLDGVKDKTEEP